jgi:hypothetical protein
MVASNVHYFNERCSKLLNHFSHFSSLNLNQKAARWWTNTTEGALEVESTTMQRSIQSIAQLRIQKAQQQQQQQQLIRRFIFGARFVCYWILFILFYFYSYSYYSILLFLLTIIYVYSYCFLIRVCCSLQSYSKPTEPMGRLWLDHVFS